MNGRRLRSGHTPSLSNTNARRRPTHTGQSKATSSVVGCLNPRSRLDNELETAKIPSRRDILQQPRGDRKCFPQQVRNRQAVESLKKLPVRKNSQSFFVVRLALEAEDRRANGPAAAGHEVCNPEHEKRPGEHCSGRIAQAGSRDACPALVNGRVPDAHDPRCGVPTPLLTVECETGVFLAHARLNKPSFGSPKRQSGIFLTQVPLVKL